MKIEITYNNGEKYITYISVESYDNLITCLMDDISASVLHSMGKAEEGET